MKEPVYLGMQYPSGKADSANCTELHNRVIEDAAYVLAWDNLQSQSANEQMSTTWSKQRIDTKEMYDDDY